MWPILVTALVAVCVVGERTIWWTMQSLRRDPGSLEQVLASLETGDFAGASRQSKDSTDPVLRMIWHGLNHVHYSLQGRCRWRPGWNCARRDASSPSWTRWSRSPPARLLGTVTGIMRSFLTLGGAEVQSRRSPAALARRSSPRLAAWHRHRRPRSLQLLHQQGHQAAVRARNRRHEHRGHGQCRQDPHRL